MSADDERVVARDADSGRFVSEEDAAARPAETVHQTVRPRTSPALAAVLREYAEHYTTRGYSPEHDDRMGPGGLAHLALIHLSTGLDDTVSGPVEFQREVRQAAALAVRALEALDRLFARAGISAPEPEPRTYTTRRDPRFVIEQLEFASAADVVPWAVRHEQPWLYAFDGRGVPWLLAPNRNGEWFAFGIPGADAEQHVYDDGEVLEVTVEVPSDFRAGDLYPPVRVWVEADLTMTEDDV